MKTLPEECVSKILSYTSPREACRFSLVSSTLRPAADSDLLWQTFFPSDFHGIISRALTPINPSSSSSSKLLFFALSHPILLDGGNMSFLLDKCSGKKSFILSARLLSITWSNDPLYWSWRSMPESRFKEVAELRTMNWLEIEGRIGTGEVTGNTWYGAYLIMKISHREYGLDCAACEVSVRVGKRIVASGKVYLRQKEEKKAAKEGIGGARKREDGWYEVELGEFFSGDSDEEVAMRLMEVGYHLKAGLIVEGIEIRPKHGSL